MAAVAPRQAGLLIALADVDLHRSHQPRACRDRIKPTPATGAALLHVFS